MHKNKYNPVMTSHSPNVAIPVEAAKTLCPLSKWTSAEETVYSGGGGVLEDPAKV